MILERITLSFNSHSFEAFTKKTELQRQTFTSKIDSESKQPYFDPKLTRKLSLSSEIALSLALIASI